MNILQNLKQMRDQVVFMLIKLQHILSFIQFKSTGFKVIIRGNVAPFDTTNSDEFQFSLKN